VEVDREQVIESIDRSKNTLFVLDPLAGRRADRRRIFTKSYEIFNAVWKAEGAPIAEI
jgi:hypothetical protein